MSEVDSEWSALMNKLVEMGDKLKSNEIELEEAQDQLEGERAKKAVLQTSLEEMKSG